MEENLAESERKDSTLLNVIDSKTRDRIPQQFSMTKRSIYGRGGG